MSRIALRRTTCVAILFTICTHMVGAALAQAPKSQERPADETSSIGVARMRPDGTIVLQLIARAPGGAVGHGMVEYPPDHPRYQDVLRHLGGMKPGEVKNVPPFPD